MEQNKISNESDVIKTTEKVAYDNFSKDGAGVKSGSHIPISDDRITLKPDEKVIKVAVAKNDVLNHEPPMRHEPPMKK